MKLVNLTPHEIVLVRDDVRLVFPPSGTVARCEVLREELYRIVVANDDGSEVSIPITSVVFGDVTGLPLDEDGTMYIVSSLVAQALPNRDDLLIPDDTVRDEHGRIVGCRSLSEVR